VSEEILRAEGLRKTFPGVVALDGVDLGLRTGEVHVLLGENGAGKSTLIKILSGAYHPDEGRILMAGRPVHLRTAGDAQRLGSPPSTRSSTSSRSSRSRRTSRSAARRAGSGSWPPGAWNSRP
jgi:ABC-type multidrug transport system ATPase subunit